MLRRKGEEIIYTGLSGQEVNVSATASSLANQTVTMSNLPAEDFIVVMTGSGARSVSALYDKPVSIDVQDELLVEVMNDSGTLLEIFDKDTGHSIATRVIDDNGKTEETFNPNGSIKNIAGIFNKEKNVLGMMPHPERMIDQSLSGEDGSLFFKNLINNIK